MHKTIFSLAVALFLVAAPSVVADDPKPAPTPSTSTARGQWNVRVEVLMVALPEEKALALLPDLRDAAKIDAAHATLLEMIRRKEAHLTGYPVVNTVEGQQAQSETCLGKIYPTQFESPQAPTAFEYRRTGPQLSAKCQVAPGGQWIQIELQAMRVELLGFDTYATGKVNADGSPARIEQPQFFNPTSAGTLAVRNDQRLLIGFHRSVKPEGEIELFVLQASATPFP